MSETSEKPEELPVAAAPGCSPEEGGRGEGGEEETSENGGGAVAVGALDATPSSALSPVTEEPTGDTKKKIDVLLKAVGDTPIMKTKKWTVERTRTIQSLIDFIKNFSNFWHLNSCAMCNKNTLNFYIGRIAEDAITVFIYVNQSFAPSPDQEVGTLYECFGSDGKLVLHYCKTQAWG